MKRLILLVGVPGSGKTTLAKKLTEKGFERLCADDIRFELYGDEAEAGNPREVFAIFFARLEQLCIAQKDIVIDNTNIKFDHRKQILDCVKPFNYEDVQLWLLDVPLDIVLKRNRERKRQVPEDVIARLFKRLNSYSKPSTKEGKLIILKANSTENWQFDFLSIIE